MLVCYFLPICTHLKYKFSAIHLPEMAGLVKRSTILKSTDLSPQNSRNTSMIEVSVEAHEYVLDKDYGSVKQRKKEFTIGAIIGVIGCVYAVFVFVLQIKGIFAG